MKIAFLCKRLYMSKDVITDRYGRLYEIPYQLCQQENQVLAFSLSYKNKKKGHCLNYSNKSTGTLDWFSYNLGNFFLPGLLLYVWKVFTHIKRFQPDVLIGSSDSIHCIITAFIAKQLKIPYVLDLYDNYESFGLTKIPGILPLYTHSLKQAGAVLCVSQPLADYIKEQYRTDQAVFVIESTINTDTFYSKNSLECRKTLGLPLEAKIIGLAGALTKDRGIDSLYKMFFQLLEESEDKNTFLVLAGVVQKDLPIPEHKNIIYLGELGHSKVVDFFNSLNVAVIIIMDNSFGRYSFPQKSYEILACGVPVLCSAIGAMNDVLKDYPQSLFSNESDFLNKTRQQLHNPCFVDVKIETWADKSRQIVKILNNLLLEQE